MDICLPLSSISCCKNDKRDNQSEATSLADQAAYLQYHEK